MQDRLNGGNCVKVLELTHDVERSRDDKRNGTVTNARRHNRHGMRGVRVGEASHQDRDCSTDIQEPEVSNALCRLRRGASASCERNDCGVTFHNPMMLSLAGRGFHQVCRRQRRHDQDCGPEVVFDPVDTDDELDSVVDALQHDLEDRVPRF